MRSKCVTEEEEEDVVPSATAASVKIKLSANAAPLVCITRSFEED